MAKENVYDASLGKVDEIEEENREARTTEAKKKQNQKQERTVFLKERDWTTSTDSPLTDEQKSEAITYRQALRDLPAQNGFPNIAFPTKPDFL